MTGRAGARTRAALATCIAFTLLGSGGVLHGAGLERSLFLPSRYRIEDATRDPRCPAVGITLVSPPHDVWLLANSLCRIDASLSQLRVLYATQALKSYATGGASHSGLHPRKKQRSTALCHNLLNWDFS